MDKRKEKTGLPLLLMTSKSHVLFSPVCIEEKGKNGRIPDNQSLIGKGTYILWVLTNWD